jgi:hypothetical protein
MDEKIVEKLRNNDLLSKESIPYKLYINNGEKQLLCPMLNLNNGKNIVLWPSFKLPLRSFPVHVYLYATAKYLTEHISMRKSAEKTRRKFGLPTFSHSTLSRFLKKFSFNILLVLSLCRSFLKPTTTDPPLVKRKRWSGHQTGAYENVLRVIRPVLIEGNEFRFGSDLNYGFFNASNKFVI